MPTVSSLGEFCLIDRLLDVLNSRVKKDFDDCAVLPNHQVISVDAVVDGIHFDSKLFAPEDIGHKALAVAVSDIAAMGATPTNAFISLLLPGSFEVCFIEEIYEGLGKLASALNIEISGGNVAKASELSLSITVVGSSVTPIGRKADVDTAGLYVLTRNGLGGASLGLRSKKGEQAQRRPIPLVEEGLLLQGTALAMIDISDGLVQDAGHLARLNSAKLEIRSESLPVFEGASLRDALSGGEDYALLFIAEKSELGVKIGTFTSALSPSVTVDGEEVSGGFDHFS